MRPGLGAWGADRSTGWPSGQVPSSGHRLAPRGLARSTGGVCRGPGAQFLRGMSARERPGSDILLLSKPSAPTCGQEDQTGLIYLRRKAGGTVAGPSTASAHATLASAYRDGRPGGGTGLALARHNPNPIYPSGDGTSTHPRRLSVV